MVAQMLAASVEELVVHGDDARIHIAHGTLRADHVLDLVRTDGIMVEMPFPRHWTPRRKKSLPEILFEVARC